MKIVILLDYFSKGNGISRVNENLAKEWIKKGHKVVFLTFGYEQFTSLTLIKIPREHYFLSKKEKSKIYDLIATEQPDIIFSNAGILGAIVSKRYRTICRYGGKPLNDIFSSYKRGVKSVLFALINFYFQFESIANSKIAICPSKYSARINSKVFFKKFIPIYNGLDFNRFNKKGRTLSLGKSSLLFIGEILPEKGILFLLKAFKKIKLSVPTASLHIFGANNYSPFLNLISSDKSIHYHGTVKNIEDYIRGSEVFVFPSYSESFGAVVLEAQASGKPVVSFNVSAIPEVVVKNRTGFLVKKNDLNDFVDKTLLLLSNKEIRSKMGYQGLKFSKNFSWYKTADSYLRLFKSFKK